jgi:3-methyladenine DNA glycosylase AlkD
LCIANQSQAEAKRQGKIRSSEEMGVKAQQTFVGMEDSEVKGLTTHQLNDKVADAMHRHVRDVVDNDMREAALDSAVQAVTAKGMLLFSWVTCLMNI